MIYKNLEGTDYKFKNKKPEQQMKQETCKCGSNNYGYNFAVCYDCGKVKDFNLKNKETLLNEINRKEMEIDKLKVRYINQTKPCLNNECECFNTSKSLNCNFYILVELCSFYKSI